MIARSLAPAVIALAASGGAVPAGGPRPFDQNPAFAEEALPRFYGGAAGGAVHPNRFDTVLTLDLAGVKLKATADMEFRTGHAVGALFGYAISRRIAVEAEIGHASFDMKRLDFGLSSPGRGHLEGSVPVEGHIESLSAFGNLVVAPFGVGILTPYVGAGLGAAHFDSALDAFDIFGGRIPVGAEQSETHFAAKGILGVNLALGYHFGIGARYSYLWVDTGRSKNNTAAFSGVPIGTRGKVGDFTASTLFISGNFAF